MNGHRPFWGQNPAYGLASASLFIFLPLYHFRLAGLSYNKKAMIGK